MRVYEFKCEFDKKRICSELTRIGMVNSSTRWVYELKLKFDNHGRCRCTVLRNLLHINKELTLVASWLDCRCNLVDLLVEIDRMLRPKGTIIVRDAPEIIDKVARIAHAVRWRPTVHDKEPESHGSDKILVATKTLWKL